MNNNTEFYRPKKEKNMCWVIYDYKWDEVDIVFRGLDEDCEEWWKHQRLLFPHQEGHKEYCMCMKCFIHSHL